MSQEEVASAGVWLATRSSEYGIPGVSLGHMGRAFDGQLLLLAFSLIPSLQASLWPLWTMASHCWHQGEKSYPPSHLQPLPNFWELTPDANVDPAECVSSGTASTLNWHTLPPVCSSDSLSVQSTFSLLCLPAVAIGSLILSLERLSTSVLMQPLEPMCNCVESCRRA